MNTTNLIDRSGERRLTRQNWKTISRVARQCGERHREWTPELDRLLLAQRLRECSVIRDGRRVVAVTTWSRDCDMVEGTSLTWVLAHPAAYEAWEAREYEWAEGPMHHHIITPEEASEFQSYSRDRIAEAWDNGNTTPFIV